MGQFLVLPRLPRLPSDRIWSERRSQSSAALRNQRADLRGHRRGPDGEHADITGIAQEGQTRVRLERQPFLSHHVAGHRKNVSGQLGYLSCRS